MTTSLIESPSNAPSLSARAIGEWEQAVEARDAENEQRVVEDIARKIEVLKIHLRDKLGITDADQPLVQRDRDSVLVAVSGLVFSLKDLHDADSYRDRDQLHVLVPCARRCGKDLWVHVDSLYMLGAVLQPDATNTHEFPCLRQYDENGDPITDAMGNPLPPRLPVEPHLTPEATARNSIANLPYVARRTADAVNAIAELEDERALIKPQAIRRLLDSGAATSATAAEKIVEADPEYAAHRRKQRDAEIEKWAAASAYEAAKLTATLDVALCRAMGSED